MNSGTTTIKREVLLEHIKANREKHEEEYEKASSDYNTAVKEKIKDHIEALQELLNTGCTDAGDINILHNDVWGELDKPENHTKVFSDALQMLELNPNDEVVLTFEQFQQFVNNEWRWKSRLARAMVSNRAYLSSKGL